MQISRSRTAIAGDIVKLVEAVGLRISLAAIEAHVPGFAQREGDFSWSYETDDGPHGESYVIWDGMTEEGYAALRSILAGGQVALCPGNFLIYSLEGRYPAAPNWVPITLAPAWAATFQMEGRLFGAGEATNDAIEQRATLEQEPGRWRRVWRMRGPGLHAKITNTI